MQVASAYSLTILGALQKRAMYEGTASVFKVAKRRARNKRARLSRRVNRCR